MTGVSSSLSLDWDGMGVTWIWGGVSCKKARIVTLVASFLGLPTMQYLPHPQAHSNNQRRGPGIHCLHMRLISQYSGNFGYYHVHVISVCCDLLTCVLLYIYLYTVHNSYLGVGPRFCHFVCLSATLRWSNSTQTCKNTLVKHLS